VTDTATAHQVDVSIRSRILRAAQARLELVRTEERARDGVAHTTMADVARHVLGHWTPDSTAPQPDNEGVPRDPGGNRITRRGHRKFPRPAQDSIPTRPDGQSDEDRARIVLGVIDQAVALGDLGLSALNEAARVIRREHLGGIVPTGDDLELQKHYQRARRVMLPPLRFSMAEDSYQAVYGQLHLHGTTITRALEVGLELFARTGKLED